MSERASATDSAKLLKATLRKTFPATVFSVRMSRGTAYGSVTVSWTDGPTASRVDAVCAPFVGKTFDGMDDSTHYTRNVMPDGRVTGLGYVHTARTISAQLARRCAAQVSAYFGIEMPEVIEDANAYKGWRLSADTQPLRGSHDYASTLIHQASCNRQRFTRRLLQLV